MNPPSYQALIRFAGPPAFFPGGYGYDITARDGLAFLVASEELCCVKRATGTSRLYIGLYLAGRDTARIAPTMAVIAPADGAQIAERRTVTITADAEDDLRLDHVRFSLDGVVLSRDYEAPFTWTTVLPAGAGTRIITATRLIRPATRQPPNPSRSTC